MLSSPDLSRSRIESDGRTSFGEMSTSQSARRIDRARRPSFGARVVRATPTSRWRHRPTGRAHCDVAERTDRPALLLPVHRTEVALLRCRRERRHASRDLPRAWRDGRRGRASAGLVARLRRFDDRTAIVEEFGLGAAVGRARCTSPITTCSPAWPPSRRTASALPAAFAARQWGRRSACGSTRSTR